MSLIYLQHERHGDHIVYTEEDALACEKLGWVRKPFPVVGEPEEKKKRGRPSRVENED